MMDKESAEKLSDLLLKISGDLDQSVFLAEKCKDGPQFLAYRKMVAMFLGEIMSDTLEPIYKQYPDLKPKDWI